MGDGRSGMSEAAEMVATPRTGRGRALFLFGLALAILAAAFASYSRLAALDAWRADPVAHFVGGVPVPVNLDAYYGLRWATAVHEGRFVAHADDPLRHVQRLQTPIETSEYLPGDAPLDWRPQRAPRRLPLLAGLIAAGAPIAGSVAWSAILLGPLVAGLFVVPLFLYAQRVGYPAAGLLAGLVGAAAPVYLSRTRLGYVDTDCLNLFFPWLAALTMLSIGRQARTVRVMLGAVALGVVLHLQYRWYDKPALAVLAWIAFGLHLLLQRRRVVEIAAALGVCVVVSHPIQLALGLGNVASLLGRYLGGALPPDGLSAADGLFPNVMATVAEQEGARGLAVLGEVLGHPAPAALGLAAFAVFAVMRWRECVPLLPLLAMAAFTFVSGPRFAIYLAPFAGFGLGVLVTEAVRLGWSLAASRGGDVVEPPTSGATRVVVASFLAAVLAFAVWLAPMASRAPPTSVALSTEAIQAVRVATGHMPPGARVWTWWDHGFAFAHIAGWSVFHDGGAQYTPQTHAIAYSLVTDDQAALHAAMARVDREGNRGIAALAATLRAREPLLAALSKPIDGPADGALFVAFTRDMLLSASALRHLAGMSPVGTDGLPFLYEPLDCTGMEANVLACRSGPIDLNTGTFADGRAVRRLDIVDNGTVVKRLDYPRTGGGVLVLLVGADKRIDALRVSEDLYRSNLHRMFVLGEHDPALFAEVHRQVPVLRVFRRVERPAE
jgi:undecaprenyl-diphosphooligosaccharide---protein glycotransferase